MTTEPIPTPTATPQRTRRVALRAGIGALAVTSAAVAGVSIASAADTGGNDSVETT